MPLKNKNTLKKKRFQWGLCIFTLINHPSFQCRINNDLDIYIPIYVYICCVCVYVYAILLKGDLFRMSMAHINLKVPYCEFYLFIFFARRPSLSMPSDQPPRHFFFNRTIWMSLSSNVSRLIRF